MTWSLTPLELPCAGENSKPHQYKHKLQKTKDFPKTWGFNREKFEDFRQKKSKNIILDLSKNPVEHKDPEDVNRTWFSQTLRIELNET